MTHAEVINHIRKILIAHQEWFNDNTKPCLQFRPRWKEQEWEDYVSDAFPRNFEAFEWRVKPAEPKRPERVLVTFNTHGDPVHAFPEAANLDGMQFAEYVLASKAKDADMILDEVAAALRFVIEAEACLAACDFKLAVQNLKAAISRLKPLLTQKD